MKIIGIDLGTSTTEAAIYENGKVRMIRNIPGEVVTPSAVGIDEDGNWVVGERARSQLLLSPENTAIEIKRSMGCGKNISLGRREYTPVELSARILEYVKTYAGRDLGTDLSHAVISVPAYFNNLQRQETILAAEKAGFQVERIINEPTAAAMSYGLDHMDEESHILVYDLGGGTFDVTLLEMYDGVLDVKASSGDNQLGGKDFDECLVSFLVKEFSRRYGVNPVKTPSAMVRLKDEAERCKKELSVKDSYRVLLPAFMIKGDQPLDLDITVTADQFKKITTDLMKRTHGPIDVILQDAGLLPEDIDKIILAGGSTRMPMVADDIENYLGIRPEAAVDPDYAIAQGAAIQAAIISGDIHPEEGLIMTDVNPFSLGVRCFDGYSYDHMSVVIPRNMTIPASRTEIYHTSFDYQTKAVIEVFQGESQIATSNHFLGRFELNGIPAQIQGKEALEVTFSYDLNGLLQVEAVVASNRRKASIRIDTMDAEKPAKAGSSEPRRIDVSGWKNAGLAGSCKILIRKAERELKKLQIDNQQFLAEELEDLLYDLKCAIIEGSSSKVRQCKKDLENYLNYSGEYHE